MNPGIPIPAQATAIHGITDADVANEKSFQEIARDWRRTWTAVTSAVTTSGSST